MTATAATADTQANGAEPQEAPVFPVATLREALPELRRPFAPGAVGFKPQHEGDSSTLCVAYIDARCVIERLNLVVGENWTAYREKADELGSNLLWCHLTVNGVTRSDVGEGQGKALVSDALKRAAVHFGIGRSLYASPALFVKTADMIGTQKGKRRLSDKQMAWLREQYEKWLRSEGVAAFGEVLSHGDALSGSVGVAVDPEGQGTADAPPPVETIAADRVAHLMEAFQALPREVDGADAELKRELKLKLGSIGVSATGIGAAFAKLTPGQADEIDTWISERNGGGS